MKKFINNIGVKYWPTFIVIIIPVVFLYMKFTNFDPEINLLAGFAIGFVVSFITFLIIKR